MRLKNKNFSALSLRHSRSHRCEEGPDRETLDNPRPITGEVIDIKNWNLLNVFKKFIGMGLKEELFRTFLISCRSDYNRLESVGFCCCCLLIHRNRRDLKLPKEGEKNERRWRKYEAWARCEGCNNWTVVADHNAVKRRASVFKSLLVPFAGDDDYSRWAALRAAATRRSVASNTDNLCKLIVEYKKACFELVVEHFKFTFFNRRSEAAAEDKFHRAIWC